MTMLVSQSDFLMIQNTDFESTLPVSTGFSFDALNESYLIKKIEKS